jgi:ferredoxin
VAFPDLLASVRDSASLRLGYFRLILRRRRVIPYLNGSVVVFIGEGYAGVAQVVFQPVLGSKACERYADLPFACKGGVCSTCRAKLIEGQVDMDRNYALEPDELEAGFILTCQSHPKSDKVMVDFDG